MVKIAKISFYLFITVLLVPNIILSFTEQLTVWGAITNTLLPAAVFYLLMCLSPKFGRSIWWMFPFVFFAAFQIILLGLYGRSVIAVDMFLNIVTTNPTEVGELLGNLLPSIALVVILYIPFLIGGTIFWIKGINLPANFLRINRKIACWLVVVGVISLTQTYITDSDYRIKRDLYPINVFYNIYLAADRSVKTANYHSSSGNFQYKASTTHSADDREVYLLIIGETSRAANWQLMGYGRNTNPALSRRTDIFVADSCLSESNTTHKSVPMLLSPLDATNFENEIYKTKSLVTAFKEAGFNTVFISNQRRNRSFIDFFADESDSTIFVKESDNYAPQLKSDLALLPSLDKVLSSNHKKQLIILHTYGSHFNYNDRYDDQQRKFSPTDFTEASKAERAKLINAYDNSIVSTDKLIAECISRLESIPSDKAVLLYTSDHGEDIFDDESGHFLHASPRPSMHQVHVPFVVWLSNSYAKEHPEKEEALKSNIKRVISSSRSFCPTILDIAGINVGGTTLVDSTASLVSKSYTPREPLYLNDHNEAVKLSRIL